MLMLVPRSAPSWQQKKQNAARLLTAGVLLLLKS